MYKLFLVFGLLVTALACKKQDGVDGNWQSPNQPNLDGLNAFFNENKFYDEVSYVFDQGFTQNIVSLNGIEFTIGNNIFQNESGNSVVGNITVKILEANTKAKAILYNLPKMGGETIQNVKPMETLYAFRVVAYQSGQELSLKPGRSFDVKIPLSSGLNSNLKVFIKQSENDLSFWLPSSISVVSTQPTTVTCTSFETTWMTVGREESSSQETLTNVEIVPPNGYADSNLIVYVAYDGKYKSAQFLNMNADGHFTASPDFTIPVGQKVHFIAISFINGVLHFSIKPTNIHNFHFDVLQELKPTTQNALYQILENLP